MPRDTKKIILTALAAMFVIVAGVLSFVLLTNPQLFSSGDEENYYDEDEYEWGGDLIEGGTSIETKQKRSPEAKFLWEFGWQAVAEELPSQAPTTTAVTTTAPVMETYYEAVTDWKGDLMTDRYGQPITQVREFYTDVQYWAMTDAGGNIARDDAGNYMMEVQTVAVTKTTQAPPLTMQDGHGNIVTNKKGQPVTKKAKPTVYVTNPQSVGATYQGEGISDGENYIGVRVILDQVYDIAVNGAMTVGMTYKIDKKIYLKSLTYNIDQGTCRVSKDENYTGMVALSKENGRMVVTLSIPDAAQIPVSQMRLLSANSLFGTFRDPSGNYIDGFTVNVL